MSGIDALRPIVEPKESVRVAIFPRSAGHLDTSIGLFGQIAPAPEYRLHNRVLRGECQAPVPLDG